MNKSLTDSQINLWKTIIALIHVDGIEHPDELEFLRNRFAKLQLTDKQKAELEESLKKPGSVEDCFVQITEPRDRSQFIYFARLLFWSDGDFSEQERKIHEQLKNKVMSAADITSAMHKLDNVSDEWEQWVQTHKQNQPIHRKIINLLVFWDDLDVVD